MQTKFGVPKMGTSRKTATKTAHTPKMVYSPSVSCSVMSDSLQPHGLYVAYQSSLSMGFSRQEYWSGLPIPSPGDFPNPGTEPRSPTLQADSLQSEPPGKP